ncbi:PcaR/PcaU/PobR family beta-ketoadipate pathway transcriptional regulator [Streptacidiphilus sp. MAP12-16]|uniref:IclR family transcriptional regulator domain-containing protein n=1 Tax=Streptacidiphilus sp. MAP12-16 TaxID=3156300 RepID=UPI003512A55E
MPDPCRPGRKLGPAVPGYYRRGPRSHPRYRSRATGSSLARGLSVLTAFAQSRSALKSADVARITGLPRATALRALITLDHLGYVTNRAGLYHPNAAILSLGYAPLSRLSLAQLTQLHLTALSSRLSGSASMTVLSGTDILYVARAAATRLMTVDIAVGAQLPAYATAMGRVLLAGLPEAERVALLAASNRAPLTPHTVTDIDELLRLLQRTAADGYALVDDELEVGLRSIAVPVHTQDGRVHAAINIAMHPSRHTVTDCIGQALPALRSATQAIEHDLAAVGRLGLMPLT